MTAGIIEIVEVGPRDGLQNEDVLVTTETKVELIGRLVAGGLRRIEAASFVHPRLVPQMADAEAVMAALPDADGVSYIGLALNERGVHRALVAGVDEVNFVVVATDTFSMRNQGSTTAESLEAWERVMSLGYGNGTRFGVTIGAAFGCPFEGEVPVDRVVEVATRVADAGAAEITLADTIGVASPGDVTRRFVAVREAVGPLPLRDATYREVRCARGSDPDRSRQAFRKRVLGAQLPGARHQGVTPQHDGSGSERHR